MSTMTTSAFLPGSSEPISSSHSIARAPPTVVISRATYGPITVGSTAASLWAHAARYMTRNMSSTRPAVAESLPSPMVTPAATIFGIVRREMLPYEPCMLADGQCATFTSCA